MSMMSVSDMQEEQAKHAFFLSLAALLGEKVFNFGELLAHKVTSTAAS